MNYNSLVALLPLFSPLISAVLLYTLDWTCLFSQCVMTSYVLLPFSALPFQNISFARFNPLFSWHISTRLFSHNFLHAYIPSRVFFNVTPTHLVTRGKKFKLHFPAEIDDNHPFVLNFHSPLIFFYPIPSDFTNRLANYVTSSY